MTTSARRSVPIERDRDVEGREREQHVFVEDVFGERDDGVGEAEAERDAEQPAGEGDARPSVAKMRRMSRARAPTLRSMPISRVRSSTTIVIVLMSATMLIATIRRPRTVIAVVIPR